MCRVEAFSTLLSYRQRGRPLRSIHGQGTWAVLFVCSEEQDRSLRGAAYDDHQTAEHDMGVEDAGRTLQMRGTAHCE